MGTKFLDSIPEQLDRSLSNAQINPHSKCRRMAPRSKNANLLHSANITNPPIVANTNAIVKPAILCRAGTNDPTLFVPVAVALAPVAVDEAVDEAELEDAEADLVQSSVYLLTETVQGERTNIILLCTKLNASWL